MDVAWLMSEFKCTEEEAQEFLDGLEQWMAENEQERGEEDD